MSRHIHRYNWYWFDGSGWRVNAKGSGLLTHILRPMLTLFASMLDSHSKVFVYRFDLRIPEHTADNKVISDFLRRLKKRIKAHYKTGDVAYFWVREQERAKRQHYHVALILDGHKVRHPYQINLWIHDYSDIFDLTPHYSSYWNVRRDRADFESKKADACYHISYLAKSRGKGSRPPQTKDFGHSRFRSKQLRP